jgi:hypothetical protein
MDSTVRRHPVSTPQKGPDTIDSHQRSRRFSNDQMRRKV